MADVLDLLPKPVLVLGASGFIGARLVAALSNSLTYRPIAASRRARPGSGKTCVVDASNAAMMQAALQGVDYVVNCIAGSSRTMIASTQTLCDAARANPPMRIVHLSSMAVYGSATGTAREDQPPVAPLSDYGAAKVTCERIMQKYVHDGGNAVILRPTCVFGPGSTQWTSRIARLLEARRIGDLGPAGDGCCNLTFIDDLVAGIVRALRAPGISGQVFNVSSSATLTWNQFLVHFAKALGTTPVMRVSPRTLKLETSLLAPARWIAEIGLRRVGVRSTLTEAITPSLLALMGQDIRVDCSAAVAALALPRTSAEKMIATAAEWLNGDLPPVARSHGWMEAISS